MAWIKLDRSIKDHWLWNTDEPFTKGQAWTDLLIHANYKDRTIHIKGQQVQLLRGQQARSELALSKVWGWSKNKVRRFLKLLKNEGMIDQQANHLTSIITICNYNKYQSQDAVDETSSGTSDETSSGTSDEHLTEHGIRSKEVKKEKNNPPKSPKGDELPDIPDFIDKNQFEAYLDIRKKIKAVNSPQAITALINRLRKYTNENPVIAKQIIEESIVNSWKTVYPLKEEIRPKAVANGDYQPPKLKPFNFDD